MPPDVDVILAGDTWYEGRLAERVLPWLRSAAARGTRVLLGDPGRRYLPASGLSELARYDVRTTTTLEDRDVLEARVLTLA
jgi:predicted nicotinamide N-methyase